MDPKQTEANDPTAARGKQRQGVTKASGSGGREPGVQELVNASISNDLKKAAPHLKKWVAFSKNVLEPKVKNLNALKTVGVQEAQLKKISAR